MLITRRDIILHAYFSLVALLFSCLPLPASAQSEDSDYLTMCGGGIGALPSPWQRFGSDLAYSAGQVGIGTNSPSASLDVNGEIRANNLLVGGQPVQQRITGSCPSGQFITAIATNGTVSCAPPPPAPGAGSLGACRFCESCGGDYTNIGGRMRTVGDWGAWEIFGADCSSPYTYRSPGAMPNWYLCCKN